jgi:hypothetical protein
VLEEVGSAVGLVGLGTAAGVNPHADGRCLGPWGVLGSDLRNHVNGRPRSAQGGGPTVKPLLSVVDSVLVPYETGVARPRVKGDLEALTLLMAARERKLRCRLSASCREAIASARGTGEMGMGR